MQTIEQLDKVLSHPAITVEPVAEEDGFNRNRTFTALDQKYEIEWWANIQYLFIGNATIVFDSVRVQATWPNHFKNNLQFYDTSGEVVCVVPIERYQKGGEA
jgi:hypothetical protein